MTARQRLLFVGFTDIVSTFESIFNLPRLIPIFKLFDESARPFHSDEVSVAGLGGIWGLSEILCVSRLMKSLAQHESIAELDSQLCFGSMP